MILYVSFLYMSLFKICKNMTLFVYSSSVQTSAPSPNSGFPFQLNIHQSSFCYFIVQERKWHEVTTQTIPMSCTLKWNLTTQYGPKSEIPLPIVLANRKKGRQHGRDILDRCACWSYFSILIHVNKIYEDYRFVVVYMHRNVFVRNWN